MIHYIPKGNEIIEPIYFDGREFHSKGKLKGQEYNDTANDQESLLFMVIQKLNEVIEYINTNGKKELAEKGEER